MAPRARCARELGIDPDQGRRYSWGYPACPDQSEHEKVWRLLRLEEIGMTLSGGYAVMPEQSTVAIVAHHPQAVYFGMKSGFIPKDKAPDELIAGTERGGELPPESDPARRLRRGRGDRRRRAPAGLDGDPSLGGQPVGDLRLGEPLQLEPLLGGGQLSLLQPGGDPAMRLGAQQDLAGTGRRLQPGGEIGGLAADRDVLVGDAPRQDSRARPRSRCPGAGRSTPPCRAGRAPPPGRPAVWSRWAPDVLNVAITASPANLSMIPWRRSTATRASR